MLPKTNLFKFTGFLFLVYYLPVILLVFDIIPFSFRFHMLVIITIFLIILSIFSHYSLKSLGLRIDTLKKSLLINVSFSAILILLMFIAYHYDVIRKPTIPTWNLFFIFYVFISSPSQEFLYRGFLFSYMERYNISSPLLKISISTITYSFLHIIYFDFITIIVTLMMGLIWGYTYYRNPNLIGVSFSHAVLGVVSILVGII